MVSTDTTASMADLLRHIANGIDGVGLPELFSITVDPRRAVVRPRELDHLAGWAAWLHAGQSETEAWTMPLGHGHRRYRTITAVGVWRGIPVEVSHTERAEVER